MAKISDEAYKELQQILEKQYGEAFTLEDVKEIGDGFIDFYNLLSKLVNSDNEAVTHLYLQKP